MPSHRSGTLQESEVEGCEYEDDSYVHRQSFPEPILEEQEIDRNDHSCHQQYVEYGGRLISHISPLHQSGAPALPNMNSTALLAGHYPLGYDRKMQILAKIQNPWHSDATK